jgi:rhomboid protease GluP
MLAGIVAAAGFGGAMDNAALVQPAIFAGEWWRLVTAVFVHVGLLHLIFNALVLALIGRQVEVLFGRLVLAIVFLTCALAGFVFSLFFSHAPSAGASGGILGLAGFLAMAVRHRNGVALSATDRSTLQYMVATLACYAAFAGLVAFDLVDSAAHLGGLLAGLGWGAMVRDPKRLDASRSFRIVGHLSIGVLVAGAILAMVLMFRPAPQRELGVTPAAGEFRSVNPQHPASP